MKHAITSVSVTSIKAGCHPNLASSPRLVLTPAAAIAMTSSDHLSHVMDGTAQKNT